ncbi:MAG: 3-hydroxyacyl-CoA dehydrogenase family protein [Firmicutes bacterium]|nr:3-hydroxyacyl-CoA dehydrogenase family protein [Bacillota bacterium]
MKKNKVVVAGAGTMGTSLAQIFAGNGFDVTLYNRSPEGLKRAEKLIELNQAGLVDEGLQSAESSKKIIESIVLSTDKNEFSDCAFVVENIVENMEAKHSFWHEISEIAPDEAVLTTNTSGLCITEMAEAVKLPERFAGMHFWNPPHIVPLVEIIRGEKTNDKTVNAVYEMAEKIGKKPIAMKKEMKGFIGNRLQHALLREAAHIVESGAATIEDVDKAVKFGIGFRYACVGPFETADFGGLDTFSKVAEYLMPDLSKADNAQMLSERAQKQWYGVKNGKGFYDYPENAAEEAIMTRDKNFIKLYKTFYGK